MWRWSRATGERWIAAGIGWATGRIESIEEAAALDARIAAQWSAHPRRFVTEPTEDFLHKAAETLALLREEIPACCRHHVRKFFWDDGAH